MISYSQILNCREVMQSMCFAMLFCVSGQMGYADTLECSNDDFEARCYEGSCEVNTQYTSFSVYLDTVSGEMRVCAYSDCYSGTAVLLRNNFHVVFSGLHLAGENSEVSFQVALDLKAKIATINGETFAMPLLCE